MLRAEGPTDRFHNMGGHFSCRFRQHRSYRLCDCGIQGGRWRLKIAGEATAGDPVKEAAVVEAPHSRVHVSRNTGRRRRRFTSLSTLVGALYDIDCPCPCSSQRGPSQIRITDHVTNVREPFCLAGDILFLLYKPYHQVHLVLFRLIVSDDCVQTQGGPGETWGEVIPRLLVAIALLDNTC